MKWYILLEVFFLGIGLSADAFSVALTDGLTYTDIDKKKSFFIAFVFGFMQALMPLIGFWIVYLAETLAESGGLAGNIAETIVTWLAFVLLMFIGVKMLIESIKEVKKPQEEKNYKKFSIKEVIFYGFATAIDALAAGVAMKADLSNEKTIWLHVAIIFACTFCFSLVGLFLGNKITKLLKGKYEIAGIIGGCILILLAIWVVTSHYLPLPF